MNDEARIKDPGWQRNTDRANEFTECVNMPVCLSAWLHVFISLPSVPCLPVSLVLLVLLHSGNSPAEVRESNCPSSHSFVIFLGQFFFLAAGRRHAPGGISQPIRFYKMSATNFPKIFKIYCWHFYMTILVTDILITANILKHQTLTLEVEKKST